MRICVAISSCLFGHAVRYDGAHKHCTYVTDTLSEFFDFVPLCPEVAIGMGVPRPPIQLVQTPDGMRALGVENASIDMTSALHEYGRQVCEHYIRSGDIYGYIFKQGSPSCGLQQVRVIDDNNTAVQSGRGIYAAVIATGFPGLPMVEEQELLQPEQRERFIQAVMKYYRSQQSRRS